MSAYLKDRPALLALLQEWVAADWLRAVDYALVKLLAELDEQASAPLLLAAALASYQLGQGHLCLDLAEYLANPDAGVQRFEPAQSVPLPSQILAGYSLAQWRAACSGVLLESAGAPLHYADDCLYLRRYWDYQQQVAADLTARLAAPLPTVPGLRQRLERLFGPPQEGYCDWQKLACALASRGRFTLITGGPGTGKTTTVVRLLALLQEEAMERGAPLKMRLAAPTGKAAARLSESIGGQIAHLAVDSMVRAQIPSEVSTLHRLLGSVPNSRSFRHHAGNPLALDVLVIDEASMIDLELLANVLAALPAQARLIVLGDKDQLASVEAGAVLGDLCWRAEQGGYTAHTLDWLEQHSGEPLAAQALEAGERALPQQRIMLRHSRRFAGDSGIGHLAQAVNAGDAFKARHIVQQGAVDLHCLTLNTAPRPNLPAVLFSGRTLSEQVLPGYQQYLQLMHNTRPAEDAPEPVWEAWAAAVLDAFERFRLLCALREGPWGVTELNQRIAEHLQGQGLLTASQGWYEGRPVLVSRNDYGLELMNGDIGIALQLPDGLGAMALRVVFARNDGSGRLRFILPSRLTAVDSVFAMTVHKSQGSEFAHCALLMPPSLSPVLTRELIYTAITRAKQGFTLLDSEPGVFEQAVRRQVLRRSGLRKALLGE